MTNSTRFSLTRIAKYHGRALDAVSDECCPCTECHDSSPLMTVAEVGYGCCVHCLNEHAQIDITPTAEDFAARDRRALDEAGVPHGYRRMTFETWQGKVPVGLDQWSGKDRWSVLLYGPTGTGKTHLAVAVVQRCLRIGETGVAFYMVSELLRLLKEEFDTGIRLLDTKLRAAWLLVLDDVFSERDTEWARSTVLDLLRIRHAEGLATILTTNLAPREIGAIDARTASRLSEGYQIQTVRRDFRATKAGQAA